MAMEDDFILNGIEIEPIDVDLKDLHESFTITWTLPDYTEVHFELIGVFALEDRQYMALHPMEEEESSVCVVPYIEGKDGELQFDQFKNEDEFVRAKEYFIEWFIKEDLLEEQDMEEIDDE